MHRIGHLPAGHPGLERHREALQHLVRAVADDVSADDAFVRAGADELHCGLGAVLGQCVVHRGESGGVDLDVAEARARGQQQAALSLAQRLSTKGRVADRQKRCAVGWRIASV